MAAEKHTQADWEQIRFLFLPHFFIVLCLGFVIFFLFSFLFLLLLGFLSPCFPLFLFFSLVDSNAGNRSYAEEGPRETTTKKERGYEMRLKIRKERKEKRKAAIRRQRMNNCSRKSGSMCVRARARKEEHEGKGTECARTTETK